MKKVTIVIWTPDHMDPGAMELEDLGREATSGLAICSDFSTEIIKEDDQNVPQEVVEFFALDEL